MVVALAAVQAVVAVAAIALAAVAVRVVAAAVVGLVVAAVTVANRSLKRKQKSQLQAGFLIGSSHAPIYGPMQTQEQHSGTGVSKGRF